MIFLNLFLEIFGWQKQSSHSLGPAPWLWVPPAFRHSGMDQTPRFRCFLPAIRVRSVNDEVLPAASVGFCRKTWRNMKKQWETEGFKMVQEVVFHLRRIQIWFNIFHVCWGNSLFRCDDPIAYTYCFFYGAFIPKGPPINYRTNWKRTSMTGIIICSCRCAAIVIITTIRIQSL